MLPEITAGLAALTGSPPGLTPSAPPDSGPFSAASFASFLTQSGPPDLTPAAPPFAGASTAELSMGDDPLPAFTPWKTMDILPNLSHSVTKNAKDSASELLLSPAPALTAADAKVAGIKSADVKSADDSAADPKAAPDKPADAAGDAATASLSSLPSVPAVAAPVWSQSVPLASLLPAPFAPLIVSVPSSRSAISKPSSSAGLQVTVPAGTQTTLPAGTSNSLPAGTKDVATTPAATPPAAFLPLSDTSPTSGTLPIFGTSPTSGTLPIFGTSPLAPPLPQNAADPAALAVPKRAAAAAPLPQPAGRIQPAGGGQASLVPAKLTASHNNASHGIALNDIALNDIAVNNSASLSLSAQEQAVPQVQALPPRLPSEPLAAATASGAALGAASAPAALAAPAVLAALVLAKPAGGSALKSAAANADTGNNAGALPGKVLAKATADTQAIAVTQPTESSAKHLAAAPAFPEPDQPKLEQKKLGQEKLGQEKLGQEKLGQEKAVAATDAKNPAEPAGLLGTPGAGSAAPAAGTAALAAKPLTPADRAALVRQAADGVGAAALPEKLGRAQQISVQLHPKDWGSLQVSVSVTSGTEAAPVKTVTAHIVAETPQVKAALQSQTGALHEALRGAGLHLDHVTVSVKPASDTVQAASPGAAAEFTFNGSAPGQGDAGGSSQASPGQAGPAQAAQGQADSSQAGRPSGADLLGSAFGGAAFGAGSQNGRHGQPPPGFAALPAEPEPEEPSFVRLPGRPVIGRIDTHV